MITIDFNRLSISGRCSVLDIGCGSGRHTAAAFDRSAGLVIGADTKINDLSEAKDRLLLHESLGHQDKNSGRWALTGADITRLPFADHRFDVVLCSEVLEHIHDHHRAIAEMVRVLKRGGQLVVSVPRGWPEAVCWALSRDYRRSEGGHVRIYAWKKLVEIIQSSGVRHLGMHFSHSLHTPYWWLKCLLGPNRDDVWPVRQYHRFLTWEMMQQPRLTKCLERCFNPLMGKSVVLYFGKPPSAG